MMKKPILTAILALLAVSVILAQDVGKSEGEKKSGDKAGNVDTAKVTWYPYDVGLGLAEKENKHVMVDFATKWCFYCKKMDKEVFTRPDVIEMLNENFISIKVDGESKKELNIGGYKITERNLAISEYRIRGYPAFWFLKPNSEKLGILPGYQKPEVLLEVLYFMKEKLYDDMKFNEYMKKGGRKSIDKG